MSLAVPPHARIYGLPETFCQLRETLCMFDTYCFKNTESLHGPDIDVPVHIDAFIDDLQSRHPPLADRLHLQFHLLALSAVSRQIPNKTNGPLSVKTAW